MIKVRELDNKEKRRHKNMSYIVTINDHSKYFTKKALEELGRKITEELDKITHKERGEG